MPSAKRVLESAHAAMHFPKGEVRQHTGEPSKAVQAMPWYYLCPKGKYEQLRWREFVRLKGAEDRQFAHAIRQACEEDILFFANTMCYVFEPRIPARLPLNTWADQDDCLCIAQGTLVVTDHGLVPIEKIQPKHRVWDGVQFVNHSGLANNGVRATMEVFGVRLTPDHEVLTDEGWKAAQSINQRTRRAKVRMPQGYLAGRLSPKKTKRPASLYQSCVRLREHCFNHSRAISEVGTEKTWSVLQSLLPIAKKEPQARAYVVGPKNRSVLSVVRTDVPLPRQKLSQLRRSWNICLQAMAEVRELPGRHGGKLRAGIGTGSHRQQRQLRTEQLSMDYPQGAVAQSPHNALGRYASRPDDYGRGFANSWRSQHNDVAADSARVASGGIATSQARKLESKNVYDILNCGPRRRFVVVGSDGPVIVHNCWMEECFGKRDFGCEKARDLSLSWNSLVEFYKHWLCDHDAKMGLVSLTEDKVDAPDDSDSLMWKLDFLHSWLPDWWRLENGQDILERGNTAHKFHNRSTRSTITGYACTGNVVRGGRKIAMLMDEFGEWNIADQQRALDSTQYAVKSRFVVSTFTSDSDRFFDIMRREESVMLKVICDWRDNPEKKKGLYTAIGGRLKILDDKAIFPPDYPFVLDGKVRSPYYDEACTRLGSNPQSIARELDRDPQGTSSKVFSAGVLQKARESCREPYFRGNLDFNSHDLNPIWIPDEQGLFRIWRDMDPETGKLGYGGPYAIGCDIGHGSGSSITSNSSIEVFDINSGEEVIQFYSHTIRPVDFAQLAFVVCKWLCWDHDLSWAYLNFETNGEPGGAFKSEIIRLGWANVYRQVTESKFYREKTEIIGQSNNDGGFNILSEIQRAIQAGECIIRSEKTVFEFGQYELGQKGARSGKCIHVGSRASGDAASQGTGHGDCAIAAGLAWSAKRDRPVDKQEVFETDPQAQWMHEFERKWGRTAMPLAGARDGYIDFRNAAY